ncbi:hypothetical protein [Blastopirellula marina]|uniref:Uncharacterized protein n=1 Tax=Blastopirellula marina TaxID=124 RepID=A0A2S8FH76_9BACT|nr:hypothetical protein [Blastopirellula marina]PQO31538.1 hypothetical protein C5Y98_19130 [Blastopirellula marina]PTL42844.1 hypothetical protein C5Y97_19140 [Blastopirellula marina]
MSKKLKPIALALAVIITFGVVYQSSLAKIAGAGQEWLRRQGSQFCQAGYRLKGEHVWHNEDGQTYFVYIFESTAAYRGIDPGIQILVENSEHEEVDRVDVFSPHEVLRSSVLESITPTRLEIVFHVHEPKPALLSRLWELRQGRLIRSKFTSRSTGLS